MILENKDRPAFPISEEESDRIESGVNIYTGLTKREYFAAAAMQGLLTNYIEHRHYGNSTSWPYVSEIAVMCADALLKELNKQQ